MSESVGAGGSRRKLLRWATSAAVGGFAIGYQIGVISGALLFVRRQFGLSNFEQGALVGVLPLGALIGGLIGGRLADQLGRRRTLVLVAIVVTAGTLLAAIAQSYGLMLLGRAISGLGAGAAASTIPLYLSEIAPPAIRGRLVTTHQLMITLGILTSYCIDLVFAGSESWRAMFGVGVVPAAALAAGMLRSPESPAWLYAHGESEKAKEVVLQVADDNAAAALLEDLRRSRAQQSGQEAPWKLLRSTARPALIISVTLAATVQLCGINAIISYAPSIMEKTGLSASNSILYSVIIGVVNVAATVVSIRLMDRAGRRSLLLGSLAGMCVSLLLLGGALVLPLGAAQSWLALICILAFISAFAVGLGPVFWLLVAELFPLDARAAGASIATSTNWFFNFLVGLAFLPVAGAIGQGETFWLFAAVCAFAFVFASRYVPETKGRGFSEITAELHDRWRRESAEEAPAY